jgi:hypothetical protein
MWLVALRHTKMATEVAAFRVVVPSATVSVLGSSPSNTARTEVVGERPTPRIYDLLLGPSPNQVWLADHLDEAARAA